LNKINEEEKVKQLKVAFNGSVCKMNVSRLTPEELLDVYVFTCNWARSGLSGVDFEELKKGVLQRMKN